MSFFETASLVLISDFAAASASMVSGSGANTGKAYSVKPTDGSGDFDFERGSDITATRVNKDGYIEKGRGNFLLQSNQFDTTWVTGGINETSGQSGYDGSNDAWLLESTLDYRSMSQTISLGNGVYTLSAYLKNVNTSTIGLSVIGSSTSVINVNLSNGTITSQSGPDIISKSSEVLENGWYRVSITINQSITSIIFAFNETAGKSYYIQDVQLEQGLVATDYIETTTVPLRAGLLEDEPRFDYHNSASASPSPSASLLLEPSRTNLVEQSEYFDSWTTVTSGTGLTPIVTNNYTISPEGVKNATRLQLDIGTGTSDVDFAQIQTSISTTTGTTYAGSIYFKSNTGVNQDIVFQINGQSIVATTITPQWTRYDVSAAATSTGGFFRIRIRGNEGTNKSADFSVYGAQLEEGSYPTSYIPTYGTSGTRGAEIMQSDTSPFGITDEFTLFIDTNGALVDGTSLNQMDDLRWYTQSTNRYRFYKSSNAIFISNNIQVDDRTKIALKITATECKTFVDGVLNSTISLTTPFASFDSISRNTETKVKEELNQILLFPTALSNTDCEILTGATTYSSFAAMASALNYTVYE